MLITVSYSISNITVDYNPLRSKCVEKKNTIYYIFYVYTDNYLKSVLPAPGTLDLWSNPGKMFPRISLNNVYVETR